jgi:hypothetical protein
MSDTITILSVDPTDADELLEIGLRKQNNENLLLIVPLVPEGHKEYYTFCDITNYDEKATYDNAFKMAFWLAKSFPDTVVYIDRDIVDKRNPVNQTIYHHLATDLPDITEYISNVNIPLNLCLNLNQLQMIVATYSHIRTNVGRPCTGFVYLLEKRKLENRVKIPVYVQGGAIYGNESKTFNIENMFNRTPRESMNMARNPEAFLKLVKAVKGNICVIPTEFNKLVEVEKVFEIADSIYPPSLNNPDSVLNKCIKKYYSQSRFKNGAKLFDLDLYNIEKNPYNYVFTTVQCAIKREIGELECHDGVLSENTEYENFPSVLLVNHKRE